MQLDNGNLILTNGWIGGEEVIAEQQFAVVNPATLDTVASVSDLDAAHAQDAIAVAAAAFTHWKALAPGDRAGFVVRWAELIEENAEDLGVIVCCENGKPLGEAKGEVLQCAALLRWYAQQATRLHGSTLPAHNDNQRNFTIKQPVGVVACITPWNFPAAAVMVKAGAAIVTGCTTIIKPSDETPLIALAFARLASEAGFPAGVYNVIPCKNPTAVGDELCRSPEVRMLSFTGSTAVGKQLYAACGDTIKRIALELGGNAPFVVFEDADLEKAVAGAVGARFYNSGQICVGANRFFIHKNIYETFAERLAERVAQLKVGNGLEATTNVGPMINRAAINRLTHLTNSATAMGAEMLTGSNQENMQDDDKTLFFTPTVLTKMTSDMPACQTEFSGL
jgi:succinate-semialdehyde dehydrogenase/glutarate-semialdehyde dehydrogenase